MSHIAGPRQTAGSTDQRRSRAHDSLVDAFTMGCVIPSASIEGVKPTKVSTIAGLAQLALARELYFNLHTTGQTYYGDIRGQLHPAEQAAS